MKSVTKIAKVNCAQANETINQTKANTNGISKSEKIGMNMRNIRQAIRDYEMYTDDSSLNDSIGDAFISRLARDNYEAKADLRELFRKSPAWNEELDCLIINGNRTHETDWGRVYELAFDLLINSYKAKYNWALDTKMTAISNVLNFGFTEMGGFSNLAKKDYETITGHKYHEGERYSRTFVKVCKALDIYDPTPNSDFQRKYAQLADEWSSKQISFKLFVSVNPAHFLTMSNPKNDNRGSTLTSCHSLNNTNYDYNNGCSGYARDSVTFIVFTVDDPTDKASLNNRKTTRQIFAYKPGNGLLLQSRMYNTDGGVYHAVPISKLYRDLVQREISALEEMPNLWKTYGSTHAKYRNLIHEDTDFGGYPDWDYEQFDCKISIRQEKQSLIDLEPLVIGKAGLCLSCGLEHSEGVICRDCEEKANEVMCFDCGTVIPADEAIEISGAWYCDDCAGARFYQCNICGAWHENENEDEYVGRPNGYNKVWICGHCYHSINYMPCHFCGDSWPRHTMVGVTVNGLRNYMCPTCQANGVYDEVTQARQTEEEREMVLA